MASGKFYQNPGCVDYTNSTSTAIESGTVIATGAVFGLAIREIPAYGLGAIQVEGIVEIPIASATTASFGAAAYWDATNSLVVTSAGVSDVNAKIGFFAKANVSGDTTAFIYLK